MNIEPGSLPYIPLLLSFGFPLWIVAIALARLAFAAAVFVNARELKFDA